MHIIRINIAIDGNSFAATSVTSASVVDGRWVKNRKTSRCNSNELWRFVFDAERDFGPARIHTTYQQRDGSSFSKGKPNDDGNRT